MSVTVLRQVIRFDPLFWRPWSATRCAIGVAIPLLIATGLHHPSWGVLASLGALYAGFTSFRGTYLMRLQTMLLTTAIMAAMTWAGSALNPFPVASTICLALIAFVLALFSSTGSFAVLLSIQATAVFIVLAGIHANPGNPLGNAALVLAGGVIQILILSIVWPFDPRYPERRAVDRAYLSLAQFVANLRTGAGEQIPNADLLHEAREVIGRLKRQPREILYALRVAETLRAALAGLAQSDATLRALGREGIERADHVTFEIERALRSAAHAIRHGQTVEVRVTVASDPRMEWEEHRKWIEVISEAFERLAHPPHEVSPVQPEGRNLVLRNLFDSQTLRALSFQHASRFAIGVSLAFAVSRLWQIPHAYWLPLSTCILLRADYSTTVSRGIARLAGTLLGIAIATIIISLHPAGIALTVLILASTWLACAVFLANYTFFTAAITLFVVFSVAGAVGERAAAMERLLATLGGAALAIVANFAWPIWQSRKVAAVVKEAIGSQVAYAEKVLALFEGAAFAEVDIARHYGRLRRLEAERVVQAAEFEPTWSHEATASAWQAIMVRIDENAAVLLSCHARALDQRVRGVIDTDAKEAAGKGLEEARALLRLVDNLNKPMPVGRPLSRTS